MGDRQAAAIAPGLPVPRYDQLLRWHRLLIASISAEDQASADRVTEALNTIVNLLGEGPKVTAQSIGFVLCMTFDFRACPRRQLLSRSSSISMPSTRSSSKQSTLLSAMIGISKFVEFFVL